MKTSKAIILPPGTSVNHAKSKEIQLYKIGLYDYNKTIENGDEKSYSFNPWIPSKEDLKSNDKEFLEACFGKQKVEQTNISHLKDFKTPAIYVPDYLAKGIKCAEKINATSEGNRSAILEVKHTIPLKDLGINTSQKQEFVEKIKGVGMFSKSYNGIIFRSYYNGSPVGGQNFRMAISTLAANLGLAGLNEKLELGIKFAPIVFPTALPHKIENMIVHEHPNYIEQGFFCGNYAQEMILMPSQIRADEPQNFKFLKKDLEQTIENVWIDFKKFLELIPKTTGPKEGLGILDLGGRNWYHPLSKDLVVNKLGVWIVDLETTGAERLEIKQAIRRQTLFAKEIVRTFQDLLANLMNMEKEKITRKEIVEINAIAQQKFESGYFAAKANGTTLELQMDLYQIGQPLLITTDYSEAYA